MPPDTFPMIRRVGLSGLLVSFAGQLDEAANRAALAFRAAIDAQGWQGVEETSSSLASAFVRFDPVALPHSALEARLAELLAAQDWLAAALPAGRKLWHVPTVYGGALAPQLDEAAALAGLSADAAIEELSTTRVRVLTLGFAPGQPYLGPLGSNWDIPRQQNLTKSVPVGALVVAIRQFVLFATSAPTGWRHVGQTAFPAFRPDAPLPFALTPGDEIVFDAAPAGDWPQLQGDPMGGATWAEIVS